MLLATFCYFICLVSSSVVATEPLLVGYVEFNPYVIVDEKSGIEVVEGLAVDLLMWMSQRAKFSPVLRYVDYSNGFKSLETEFVNKSVDLAICGFIQAAGRNYIAYQVFPFAHETYTLVIPYPKEEINVWSCILPFKAEVWACFILFTILAAVFLKICATITSKIETSPTTKDPFVRLRNTVSYVVGVATNQGGYCLSRARSTRLLAGVWCLTVLVLTNAYSGSLITYLNTPKIEPLIQSLEDLATKKDTAIFTTQNDEQIRKTFQTAATGIFHTLRDNTVKYPKNYCGEVHSVNFDQCIEAVKLQGHVIALDSRKGDSVVKEDFDRFRTCGLTLTRKPYWSNYVGFAAPVNSSHEYINKLDIMVMETLEYGLILQWSKKYYPLRNPCLDYNRNPKKARKFQLGDLTSAFIILAIGYGCAVLAFIYEIISVKIQRATK